MTYSAIQPIVDHLPFHLDDTPQINALFTRWHRQPTEADRCLIDLWTYSYIYRYFHIKCAKSGGSTSASFDRLVTNAYADVQDHLHDVRQPDRFKSWVGTVCRHAFINHLRTRRSTVALDDGHPVLRVDPTPPASPYDSAVVYQTICNAVEALPPFLREVAHLRLLEQRSYEAISEITGKPMPTLRVYLNRAISYLRRNPTLCALVEEMRD